MSSPFSDNKYKLPVPRLVFSSDNGVNTVFIPYVPSINVAFPIPKSASIFISIVHPSWNVDSIAELNRSWLPGLSI